MCLVGASTTLIKAKVEASLPRKRGAAAAGYDKAITSFYDKACTRPRQAVQLCAWPLQAAEHHLAVRAATSRPCGMCCSVVRAVAYTEMWMLTLCSLCRECCKFLGGGGGGGGGGG